MTARAEGAAERGGGPADGSAREAGGPLTLDEIARMVGGRVSGDGSVAVAGLRPVDEAGPEDLEIGRAHV